MEGVTGMRFQKHMTLLLRMHTMSVHIRVHAQYIGVLSLLSYIVYTSNSHAYCNSSFSPSRPRPTACAALLSILGEARTRCRLFRAELIRYVLGQFCSQCKRVKRPDLRILVHVKITCGLALYFLVEQYSSIWDSCQRPLAYALWYGHLSTIVELYDILSTLMPFVQIECI